MKLTDTQLAEFDDLGYLFLPDCFNEVETDLLRTEAERVYAMQRQEVW